MSYEDAMQRLANALAEGIESAKSGRYECRYHSGSGLHKKFCDGFVTQAVNQDELPIDTPMLLAGRIAYLKGKGIESKPESEAFTGRWFSGWMTEKDRASRQNK